MPPFASFPPAWPLSQMEKVQLCPKAVRTGEEYGPSLVWSPFVTRRSDRLPKDGSGEGTVEIEPPCTSQPAVPSSNPPFRSRSSVGSIGDTVFQSPDHIPASDALTAAVRHRTVWSWSGRRQTAESSSTLTSASKRVPAMNREALNASTRVPPVERTYDPV